MPSLYGMIDNLDNPNEPVGGLQRHMELNQTQPGQPEQPAQTQASQPTTGDKWPEFRDAVVACFPDICLDHLQKSAPDYSWEAENFIPHVLDQQESGKAYPTRTEKRKRKRQDEDDSDKTDIKSQTERFAQKVQERTARNCFHYTLTYARSSSFLLQSRFPQVYVKDIETIFKEQSHCLYKTYLSLQEELSKPQEESRLKFKKTHPKAVTFDQAVLGIRNRYDKNPFPDSKREAELEAFTEFNTVHSIYQKKVQTEAASRMAEDQKTVEELENLNKAMAEGTMAECGCCFDEYPRNRVVCCNDEAAHPFCYACAKTYAENQVGLSKYELTCMSMDGCQGGFSHSQRLLFLDKNLTVALDRLEQEDALRRAGIESLETCPFCPYAAEYPPKEENKEFKCENEDCGVVSCRLCRGPTHIPKSCQEVKEEATGQSSRHEIEEAMTLALLRKCNKCATPFIKSSGCNKMVCAKCGSKQCYVCSETIQDYDHFHKAGSKCKLHDNIEIHHGQRVREAEQAAREKVLKENPEVNARYLEINFSDKVKGDQKSQNNVVPNRPIPPVQPFQDLRRHQEQQLEEDRNRERARQAAAEQQRLQEEEYDERRRAAADLARIKNQEREEAHRLFLAAQAAERMRNEHRAYQLEAMRREAVLLDTTRAANRRRLDQMVQMQEDIHAARPTAIPHRGIPPPAAARATFPPRGQQQIIDLTGIDDDKPAPAAPLAKLPNGLPNDPGYFQTRTAPLEPFNPLYEGFPVLHPNRLNPGGYRTNWPLPVPLARRANPGPALAGVGNRGGGWPPALGPGGGVDNTA